MSAAAFISDNATPGGPILVTPDSKQLASLGLLNGADGAGVDYIVQSRLFLKEGISMDVGFTITPSGAKKVKDAAYARKIFHGDEVKILLVGLFEELAELNEVATHLASVVTALTTLDIVILNSNENRLLEEGLRLESLLSVHPQSIWLGERTVSSVTEGQSWYPWVIKTTTVSRISAVQPKFKILKFMERGVDPTTIYVPAPTIPPDTYALQCHVEWKQELYTHLGGDKHSLKEEPGTDPKHTKFIFITCDAAKVEELVQKFGTYPRFAIMPIPWYEGYGVDDSHTVWEMWILPSHRSDHAPFFFAAILSAIWTQLGIKVFDQDSGVAIQPVSYNKVRIGLSMEARKMLIRELTALESKIGLQVKDPSDGTYVTGMDEESDVHSSVSSTWGSIAVKYIVDVPPYWTEQALRGVLGKRAQPETLLQPMTWSIGAIRTKTWKVTAPDLTPLEGAVFQCAGTTTLLRCVSAREYNQQRSSGSRNVRQKNALVKGTSASAAPGRGPKPNTSRAATSLLPERKAQDIVWAKRPRDGP